MEMLQLSKILLVLETISLLLFFKVALYILHFKRFAKIYEGDITVHQNRIEEDKIIDKVNYAVNYICFILPWENKCLIRAAVIKVMLNRRRIKSVLNLGVIRNEKNELEAHAWIEAGERLLVESEKQEQFKKLYSFN
jgi:hypothetical protein